MVFTQTIFGNIWNQLEPHCDWAMRFFYFSILSIYALPIVWIVFIRNSFLVNPIWFINAFILFYQRVDDKRNAIIIKLHWHLKGLGNINLVLIGFRCTFFGILANVLFGGFNSIIDLRCNWLFYLNKSKQNYFAAYSTITNIVWCHPPIAWVLCC